MPRYFGAFYFKLDEKDGNLTSHYLEHQNNALFPEICIRNPATQPPFTFEGRYSTTWEEPKNNTHNATLTIERDPDNNLIYTLQWTFLTDASGQPRTNLNYRGTGWIVGKLLIGSYWDIIV